MRRQQANRVSFARAPTSSASGKLEISQNKRISVVIDADGPPNLNPFKLELESPTTSMMIQENVKSNQQILCCNLKPPLSRPPQPCDRGTCVRRACVCNPLMSLTVCCTAHPQHTCANRPPQPKPRRLRRVQFLGGRHRVSAAVSLRLQLNDAPAGSVGLCRSHRGMVHPFSGSIVATSLAP